MPDNDAIKKFNEILNTLGSEQKIRMEKGESIEETPLAETGLPDDLSALLGTPELPEGLDADSIDFKTAEGEDLDQLDNIEDFLMPSLDVDDMDKDLEAENGTSKDKVPGDEAAIDEFSQVVEPTDLSLPDDTDLIPPFDSTESAEFVPPEITATETPGFPGETEQPPIDENALLEDLFKPADEEYPTEFALPEELETKQPGDEFLTEEVSPLSDFAIPSIEESVEETAGKTAIPDEFSIPGILDEEVPSTAEAFSLPEDYNAPPAEEISIPDDFSIPEMKEEEAELPGEQPAAFNEEEFKIDEFSIPEEFSVPGIEETIEESIGETIGETEKIVEETPVESEEGYGKDLLDEFAIPEFEEESGKEQVKPPAGEKAGKDEFVIDEYNLPGMDEELPIDSLDEDFIKEEIPPGEGSPVKGQKEKKPGKKREETLVTGELQLTDKQFTNLQLTLESLPRNLKIVIQDIIGGEQLTGEPLKKLIDLLVGGASPVQIADYVSRETGQKVKLPKRFEKKTGLEFARERNSFAFMFRENIIPLLKILIPALILLILISIAVIRLVVVPISADNLYKKGLVFIQKENKFNLAEDAFNDAYKLHPDKKWFYRYADAYAAKNEYKLTELKYEQLLNLRWKNGEIEFLTKLDEKGIVDYSLFETRRYDFAKAEKLLNFLLDKQKFNKAGLFAAGDNYLEWAKTDNTKFEAARLAYAKLQRTNADRKDIDFRFLRYFMRVDNFKEVERLKNLYQKNPDIKVEPYVYAELGGYLLAKNQVDDVKDVLYRAKAVKEEIPELHFNLSTYFHLIDKQADEETALRKTLAYMDAGGPLNTELREMKIETFNRLGKLYFKQQKILDAEVEYNQAREMIENGQQNSTLGRKPAFGEVYYNLGDIFYYNAMDFDEAAKLYAGAADNYYANPELYYKQGYISYINDNYLDALLAFYNAEEEIPNNINILYALGNTLYYRNDFFAAQGYYTHLLSILEKKKNAIPVLLPEENPEHLALMNFIMRTYNNLGVTFKMLAERPRDPAREADALVYLTRSSEFYDILKRLLLAPDTMERDKETKNIAYLNQRQILYPQTGFNLSLYRENPLDTKLNTFRDDWFSLRIR